MTDRNTPNQQVSITDEPNRVLGRDERKRVAALLLFAALIRIVYLYLYSRQSIWSDIVVDSLYHLNWADSIASGDILGQQTYFRAPLYVYLLALCRALAPDSILLPRLMGSALGVVSIFVTYLLVRRTVSGATGRNMALIAGVFQALYPSVIFFEAELLVDFLFAFLLQVTVYRLLIANDRKTTGAFVVAGIALGLASLTRPTALALIPFFAFFAYRYGVASSNKLGKSRRNVTGALALVAATLLVIAPVTVRNYLVGGDLTLIASSGGVNFFIGNNAESNPVSASLPQPYGANWTLSDMSGLAEEYEGRQLSPAEVSHSWTIRAVKWITQHPLQFFRNYATKLYLALGKRTYSNNRSLQRVYDTNLVLKYSPLNASILLFFAVIGTWRFAQTMRTNESAKSSRGMASLLSPLTAGLYLLIVALFFVNERFRLPTLVLLFPAAGAGVYALWNSLQALVRGKANYSFVRRLAEYVSPTTVLIAVAVFSLSLLPYGRPADNSQGRAEYLEANRFLASGELDSAIVSFHKLLQIAPRYPRAAANLGVAFFLKSESDSARRYFQLELERSPRNPEALTNLASLALTEHDVPRADSLSAVAYQVRPYDLQTLRIRIRALHAANKLDQAVRLLTKSEIHFRTRPSYWYERAQFYLSLEPPDNERAFEALQEGVSLSPAPLTSVENSDWAFSRDRRTQEKSRKTAALLRYQLGYHYGLNRVFDSAVIYSSEAIRLDSSLSAAYVNLALGYLSLGKIDSAQVVYREALHRFKSGNSASDAKENLNRLQQIMNNVK